jgi:hypothetical protein
MTACQTLAQTLWIVEEHNNAAAKLAPIAARMLFKSWLSRRPGYIQFL